MIKDQSPTDEGEENMPPFPNIKMTKDSLPTSEKSDVKIVSPPVSIDVFGNEILDIKVMPPTHERNPFFSISKPDPKYRIKVTKVVDNSLGARHPFRFRAQKRINLLGGIFYYWKNMGLNEIYKKEALYNIDRDIDKCEPKIKYYYYPDDIEKIPCE